MDSVLTSVLVTAVFLGITATVGNRLGRSRRPYGAVQLAIHLLLFLLVSGGVIASIYKLQGVAENKLLSTLSLYLAGLTLLINLAVGIAMITIKQKDRRLISAHKVSTLAMTASIVASVIFIMIKI